MDYAKQNAKNVVIKKVLKLINNAMIEGALVNSEKKEINQRSK